MSKEYFTQVAEKIIAERSFVDDQMVIDLALNLSNMYSNGYNNAKNHGVRREPYFEEIQLECPESEGDLPKPMQTMVNGSPVTPDHRELKDNGQQKDYVVLSEAERAKGFIQPLRDIYIHLTCGQETKIYSQAIVETYARDPKFYNSTFCCGCGGHHPLNEFIWKGTDEEVGS